MLPVFSSVTRRPSASERASFAAPSGSTVTTLARGASALIAVATPEESPPPPTGTATVATPGQSAAISSPIVPCPAMMAGWSNGGTTARPSASAISVARACRSADVRPASTTSPPSRSTPPRLAAVTVSGMTITARTPKRAAAYATAWPWLPEENVMTPRAPPSTSWRTRL